MIYTRELLAAVKSAQGITSDYRLARFLGVSDQTVGNWQHGRRRPDDETALRLAELAGLDPDAVLLGLTAERATDEPARQAWERIAARLARAGAAMAVACVTVTGTPDALAGAPCPAAGAATASLYIMLTALLHWIASRTRSIGQMGGMSGDIVAARR